VQLDAPKMKTAILNASFLEKMNNSKPRLNLSDKILIKLSKLKNSPKKGI
jgi:hypothetical protein